MGARLATTWLCNLIDTAATVHLFLNYEGEELNPISAWLLSKSPALFVTYKLVMMTLLVVLTWWKRDWPVSIFASWIVFVSYVSVSLYYLFVYTILIPAFP